MTANGDLDRAVVNQSVTLALTDEIDVSRGDLLGGTEDPVTVAHQFQAQLVWMDLSPMLAGRPLFAQVRYPDTPGSRLGAEIHGQCQQYGTKCSRNPRSQRDRRVHDSPATDQLAFDDYQTNRDTGGFILIDRSLTRRSRLA